MYTQPRPSAPSSLYTQPHNTVKNQAQKCMVLFQGMWVTLSQALELSQR